MTAESITESPYCLVVDDEPRLRQVLVHLMKTEGFTCVEASNGEEALVLLQRHPMTLVISDLRMPKMDGPTFYRQVQAEHPDLVERIVFMTAHLKIDEYAQFIQDVGASLLNKPFPREDLDDILGRMIGPTRSRRETK